MNFVTYAFSTYSVGNFNFNQLIAYNTHFGAFYVRRRQNFIKMHFKSHIRGKMEEIHDYDKKMGGEERGIGMNYHHHIHKTSLQDNR